MYLQKRSSKLAAFLILAAFILGLWCRDIVHTIFKSNEPAEDIYFITGGRSYVDPDFNECRAKAHPGYISRYPRKKCASNNTYIDFGSTMTVEQSVRVNACVLDYKAEFKRQLELEKKNMAVRWSSHHYLNKSSFVIEVGGYSGSDAEQFNSRYHPGTYIVLEPVAKFF
ncbi:uncharacterized protein LOC110460544 [Mizuhopecten yessoensis]|uniref:uncharacterized protein LOC110460544 n=1 Tax=Mizuhopecten yessoensis TaxID=6573 RepID=UPI000B45B608|nr:uncharacterized protein LOC110460544 [Mizuhopecten yessoensis]